MTRFDVVSLFPEMLLPFFGSVVGRAEKAGRIGIQAHQLRDFADNKWKKVDGPPAGGGPGLVLACQPLFAAAAKLAPRRRAKTAVVAMTPRGESFTQKAAQHFAESFDRFVIFCGRYEGFDERFIEAKVTHEVCVGQAVVSGGELPAAFFIDAVARLLPGVLGAAESLAEESFSPALGGRKEYPQFTAPARFRGRSIPPVLLSGDHAAVAAWRRGQLKS